MYIIQNDDLWFSELGMGADKFSSSVTPGEVLVLSRALWLYDVLYCTKTTSTLLSLQYGT